MTGLAEAPASVDVRSAHAPVAEPALEPPRIWTLDPLRPVRDLAHADALCHALAARHVENFTTISRVVPAPVRTHLARVYAFCRVTDDLGDETGSEAAALLTAWRAEVERVLLRGATPTTAVMRAVVETVRARALSAAPFLDLIEANIQDQRVRAYETWPDLLGYCRLSASPVGRMVLGVVGLRDHRAVRLSDDVCVGMQLANFAQDVSVDAAKGRRYLVGDDVRAKGVVGAIETMCDRAESLLESGEQLERMCSGWLRTQLALYRLGGLAIVRAVRQCGCDTRAHRPVLGTPERLRIAAAAAPSLFAAADSDADLGAAARECRDIARREAANFYWGFIALPRAQRESIHAVYVFARRVDDVADAPGTGSPRVRLDMERRRLRAALNGAPDDPVMRMLGVAVRRHAIPIEELEAIVSGVERDAGRVRYQTWDSLADYCRLVASSVGRICVRIFGYSDPCALERADELGLAMQLTNILRDVREDAAMGRVYIPAEDLAAAGVDPDVLVAGGHIAPGAWRSLIDTEARRARALFASGLQVCELVPYRAATCVRTMAGIYESILDDIESEPHVVLERRVSLGGRRKLGVLLRSVARVGRAS